jgi:hypothetical protein
MRTASNWPLKGSNYLQLSDATKRRAVIKSLVALSIGLWSGCAFAQDGGSLRQRTFQNPRFAIEDFIAVWRTAAKAPEPSPDAPSARTIDTCLYSNDLYQRDGETQYIAAMQNIAAIHGHMASYFQAQGYPDSVWRSPLYELTYAQVDHIAELYRSKKNVEDINKLRLMNIPYEQALGKALADYRRNANPKLIEVLYYDGTGSGISRGCGGDWIGMVKIRTWPVSREIKLIRDFYFRLCERMSILPYSDNCDMWFPVKEDTSIPQGIYRSRIRWSQKDEECEEHEFGHTGGITDKVKVSTIYRSGKTCPNWQE